MASIFLMVMLIASTAISTDANPGNTTEPPSEQTSAIEPKQADKSHGIDLLKLHSSRKNLGRTESLSSSTLGETSGTEASVKRPTAASEERGFLNGRPGSPFDFGAVFDPSVSGGFGDLGDFLQEVRQGGGRDDPSRTFVNPFQNRIPPNFRGKNHQDTFITSNVIEPGQKVDQRPQRPLRDHVQSPNHAKDRATSGTQSPGRASPFASNSDGFPRPFPVDGARGGNTGFRLSPSDSSHEKKEQSFLQPSSEESHPHVTKKGLPFELLAGEVPFASGETLEEQRAFGGPLGLMSHFDQPGPEVGNPYIDPSAAARYRLLQRYLLEDRLRTQGPGNPRRPAYGPDYYSQGDGFGYGEEPLPSLDLPAAVPIPAPTSGLRPDLTPGYTELDERYTPRCTQFYDDVYGHYNRSYCLYDPDYPTLDVIEAIKRSPKTTYRLFSDVTYQSADDLVDGLTREQEGSSSDYYVAQRHSSHFVPQGSSANGYICSSHVTYARPKRAQNVRGLWKVIVNLADEQNVPHEYRRFTQTQRIEHCLHPESSCSYVASHLSSRCLQKHNYARMVAYNRRDGLHVDSFRMPVACSCHLGHRRSFIGPHSSNSKSSSNNPDLKYRKD